MKITNEDKLLENLKKEINQLKPKRRWVGDANQDYNDSGYYCAIDEILDIIDKLFNKFKEKK